MSEPRTLTLSDEAATLSAGEVLAPSVSEVAARGLVIYLVGALGAGKTTFARGLLRGLGHAGRVPSPTYTLIEPYGLNGLKLYHIDLYRLERPAQVAELGIAELPAPGAVLLIEWPERGAGELPPADLVVALQLAEEGRRISFAAGSRAGAALLDRL